ncbi:uncharacterized protein [Amphiura filiformis]|uniref:uncharacterized protein isoform X2 n=1 Tax=Amphiura filiformis TaxID=82378 RepID=UPI003B20C2DA
MAELPETAVPDATGVEADGQKPDLKLPEMLEPDKTSTEEATDMEEDQKPSLKTGLTENLQDMGIESAEDTNDGVEEPMEIDNTNEEKTEANNHPQDDETPSPPQDDETPKPDEKEQEKEKESEEALSDKPAGETSQDENQLPQDEEVLKPEEVEEDEKEEEPAGETIQDDNQMPELAEDQEEEQVDENSEAKSESTSKEPSDQGSKPEHKDNVTDDDKLSETNISEGEDDAPVEDLTTEKTEAMQDSTTNDKDKDVERAAIRRSRSKEEELEPDEKGKTDEQQTERSAKKPKTDADAVPKRTLRSSVRPDLSKMHTLQDFGYEFNQHGELRQIKTGSSFVFEVIPNDRSFNQKHYEALGEIITKHIFQLMETECGLQKAYVPVDATEKQPRTFIFVSDHVLPVINGEEPPTDKKLLVLIHGNGVVRAGQWARRLIINNDLNMGTMIPYIKEAIKNNYEVMLLNTNYNSDKGRPIPGSSNPESHGRYVWKHFISEWPGKVAIVAHSAGGYVTVEMAKQCQGFIDKVFAVGFTDSVHSLGYYVSSNVRDWFIKHSQNWVSSSKPLDTPLSSFGGDCARVSAGTSKHEETSYYSMESIFAYFKEMEERAQEEERSYQEPDVVEEVERNVDAPEDQDMSRGESEAADAKTEPKNASIFHLGLYWIWFILQLILIIPAECVLQTLVECLDGFFRIKTILQLIRDPRRGLHTVEGVLGQVIQFILNSDRHKAQYVVY